MPREAHTILTDADGDTYEVWAKDGRVFVWMPAKGAVLGPREQEAMGQAFIAACNAADRQNAAAGRLETNGSSPCGQERGKYECLRPVGHIGEHEAITSSGEVSVRWMVSDD